MFTEDDIDRITAAVGTVSLVDPRGEYRERLRAACLSYVNARALEGEALSHLARKLEPIEKGTARTRPTEEIEKLLTAQARASGYQGAVEAATPGERSVWAHAARERLEARVARRQRYGQKNPTPAIALSALSSVICSGSTTTCSRGAGIPRGEISRQSYSSSRPPALF